VYVHIRMHIGVYIYSGHIGVYMGIVRGSIFVHTHISYTYKLHKNMYVRLYIQFHIEGEDPDDFTTVLDNSIYQLQLFGNLIRS